MNSAVFVRGVTDHFRLRAPGWAMSALLLWIGVNFLRNPDLFQTGGFGDPIRFVYLQRIFPSQSAWALICIGVASARLAALTINGTFRSFPWSPHLRTLGSVLSCFVWFQMALATSMHATGTTFPVYCVLLCLDVVEAYNAALDIDSPT